MSEAYKKLIKTLQTIFEMDKADLDFGIYRIMNQKRDEINRFLEQDLLPQVRKAFADYAKGGKSEVQTELNQLIKTLTEAGMDPEQSPKVKELRAKAEASVDMVTLENEVYSHLHTFFSRYYDKGDFISQRRYKKDTYAIPYEGEEVKLYWANHDQYYIKSSEHLRDYAFIACDESGKTVRIKLVEADTEKDNVKAESGKERRFVLDAERPLSVENGELHIHFHYIPAGKQKQDALNKKAAETILKQPGFEEWMPLLRQKAPTDKNPERTLLEKHLNEYTARNTFDYFIHKDLGGFLRRELDFYIKNEVLYLDDIDDAAFEVTEQHLRKIKVIRTIAHKIIRLLAQLEDFQKKLWLKKKFVVETNYCITLDRVPEALYPQVVDNPQQREEWVKLGFIEEDTEITLDYLKEYPSLVLDTKFFDETFKNKLLASIDDFDAQCDGLLIHSENFQALNLLQNRFRNQLKCVYIDPPYNTDASAILYKNDYKNSSWLSMINDRVMLAHRLMNDLAIICTAIDDEEVSVLRPILSSLFKKEIGIAPVRSNPQSRKSKGTLSPAHEYALFFGKSDSSQPGSLDATDKQNDRYPLIDHKGRFAWMNFIRTGTNDRREDRPKLFYPIYVDPNNNIRIPSMTWNPNNQQYDIQDNLMPGETAVYPTKKTNSGVIEKRWHRGYQRIIDDPTEYRARRSNNGEISIDFKTRMDANSMPSTWWDKKEYASSNYGAIDLKNLFGRNDFDFPKARVLVEDCLKVSGIVTEKPSVLDFYAGSGTTGHAVIELTRRDNIKRKYILVEMGKHFDTTLKPRISKVIYSSTWKDGKPTNPDTGISHCFKYIRLESYEDTLNNLILKPRTKEQADLLEHHAKLREDYMLGYWLDLETEGSPSLLNIEQFEDPFNYQLNIATGSAGATRPTRVDLVETFNYLIGLTVRHIDTIRGFKVVTGTNPKGESVLVIWRNLKEKDNDALEAFMDTSGYNPRDTEYDHIYVNGDHTLEDPQSKVKMIEIEFKRLMFDVQDV
ncbi:site-specific DNA-methyltransferase [Microbulbifer thermotolerans]|uniref:site-specific DNA-methyltransferase n=1 Tax=Microbulbifer thermotolerans TaxID=252514 RepID=UPI002249141F|nr:DNA methyltransferase [Microbulbifer thermotolerans]MCX2830537.1 DNA methyltransferase [Microbulbifer thermotolerans]